MDRGSLTVKEIKKWAEGLPDDAIVLAQVIGSDPAEAGAWSMLYSLSDELTHFKWSGPVYCITLSHPDLKSVNPNVRWSLTEKDNDQV